MASTLFTGASRYTQDFSAVIDRQVGIASLALTQMQQARQTSSDRVSALRALSGRLSTLQGTLQAVEDSVNSKALQATSSDTSAVRVTAGPNVADSSYTMQVISLGSYSTAVSKTSGVPVTSDPSTGDFVAAGTTQLTLSITDHNSDTPASSTLAIDLTRGTSLQGVVDAINATAGSGVKAAIVNVGSTDAPNYALSLQSTKLGKLALQLNNGATELMNVDSASSSDPSLGSRAQYKINGASVYSETRTVTIAPSLTADLLKASSGTDITITVSKNASTFQSAISGFITAYNAVLDTLDNYGGKGGTLAGDSILGTTRQQLRSGINNATSSGNLQSLAKIGLEFKSDGRLNLNTSLFTAETADQFEALKELVGTSTTSGFMKSATDALKSLTGEAGMLTGSISSLDNALKAEDARIAAETLRVELFTRDLQERLAKADALIAQLEQQANYFNNMFEAMRANQKSMS